VNKISIIRLSRQDIDECPKQEEQTKYATGIFDKVKRGGHGTVVEQETAASRGSENVAHAFLTFRTV
jgi:hypothetical protein